ncbi:MAG TPA: tRNA (N(6)-L-threonylcarbamoyladenosine(37)-C(2))-methylthiotransferase MtaB, partial [Planctomycetaceae bacterium]|nr:tRNA (N(6)-L-threonylcarbamoyladenosine(37)-C(2))-methylthiotransferase MtaB [Planctomycetaceae bacterium]
AFTTDMIVGFPGETDDDFEQSLAACRQVGFMKIHIFPFSARAGTKAAEFPDRLPSALIRERVTRMNGLEHELALQYYQTLVGRPLQVLVEQMIQERPGYVRGSDRRYVPVELPGNQADMGRFAQGIGEGTFDRYLRAVRRD